MSCQLYLACGTAGAVPDLTGSTQRAAALLEQLGLQVGEVTRRISERPAGTVIAQTPPAGAPVPDDATVDLVVAHPPAASPSPPPSGTADDRADSSTSTDPTPGGQPPPGDEPAEQPPDGRGPDGQGPPGRGGDPPGRD